MLVHVIKAALALAILVSPHSLQSKSDRDPCYWVNGRLMAYNGNPTYRIWPRKTHRLLGVVSADWHSHDRGKRLPPEIERLNPVFGRHVWGSFYVCPVSNERKGWMRFVLLKKGRNLTVIDYREHD